MIQSQVYISVSYYTYIYVETYNLYILISRFILTSLFIDIILCLIIKYKLRLQLYFVC